MAVTLKFTKTSFSFCKDVWYKPKQTSNSEYMYLGVIEQVREKAWKYYPTFREVKGIPKIMEEIQGPKETLGEMKEHLKELMK